MADLLSLRGVRMGYARGDRRVLADVSLALGRGDIGAVVASRYEGKTTLLRVAAGILAPDDGEVLLDGLDLTQRPRRAGERLVGREIAWIDRKGPGHGFKVRDYVGLPLTMGRRAGRREVRHLAGEALEKIGATGCAGRQWGDLSTWEQVLVQFARVIAGEPKLVVMDDLLDGLGMRRTREAGDLLRSVVEDLRCAVLMSASDYEPALVADRVWSLSGGRLTVMSDLVGPDAEIYYPPFGAGKDRSGAGHGRVGA
ncbi:MAG TPA: ABC transporter ATP-binding protein [Solirubrobacteraceae bacterium]